MFDTEKHTEDGLSCTGIVDHLSVHVVCVCVCVCVGGGGGGGGGGLGGIEL